MASRMKGKRAMAEQQRHSEELSSSGSYRFIGKGITPLMFPGTTVVIAPARIIVPQGEGRTRIQATQHQLQQAQHMVILPEKPITMADFSDLART